MRIVTPGASTLGKGAVKAEFAHLILYVPVTSHTKILFRGLQKPDLR